MTGLRPSPLEFPFLFGCLLITVLYSAGYPALSEEPAAPSAGAGAPAEASGPGPERSAPASAADERAGKLARFDEHFALAQKYKQEEHYAEAIDELVSARKLGNVISDRALLEKAIKGQVEVYDAQIADLKTDSFLWKVPTGLLWHFLVIPLIVFFVLIFLGLSHLYCRFVNVRNAQIVPALAIVSLVAGFVAYTSMWTYVDGWMHIKEIEALGISRQILQGELDNLAGKLPGKAGRRPPGMPARFP
ncbi:MAG: hypothetical protein IPM23_23555 [Candidatus Melainabacteria bacterium]|nr:hypothetical protein [Candidatus Melainabacteria bacterium]